MKSVKGSHEVDSSKEGFGREGGGWERREETGERRKREKQMHDNGCGQEDKEKCGMDEIDAWKTWREDNREHP